MVLGFLYCLLSVVVIITTAVGAHYVKKTNWWQSAAFGFMNAVLFWVGTIGLVSFRAFLVA